MFLSHGAPRGARPNALAPPLIFPAFLPARPPPSNPPQLRVRRSRPFVLYFHQTALFPDEFYDQQTGDICWRRVVSYLRTRKLPLELAQRRQVTTDSRARAGLDVLRAAFGCCTAQACSFVELLRGGLKSARVWWPLGMARGRGGSSESCRARVVHWGPRNAGQNPNPNQSRN